MSILNTTAMTIIPAAANGIAVDQVAGAWTYGSWTQLTASVTGPYYLAGITLYVTNLTYSAAELEIQIGTGSGGAETGILSFRVFLPSSANLANDTGIMLPIAFGPIANGTRIAARIRSSDSANTRQFTLALMGYVSPDSTQVSATSAPSAILLGSNGVSITPNGTGWVDSSWVEISASLAANSGIYGITHSIIASIDYEYDLGTGGAGAEVVLTTIRGGISSGSNLPKQWFDYTAGVIPVVAGTRLAIRLRKTGTSTTAVTGVTALTFDPLTAPPGVGGPGKGKGHKGGGGVGVIQSGTGAYVLQIGNPGLEFDF